MKDYPFNSLMKIHLRTYFEDMRYRVVRDDADIYWSIFDRFSGYIRGLRAAGVIDGELEDRLFEIGNSMLLVYRDKGVC